MPKTALVLRAASVIWIEKVGVDAMPPERPRNCRLEARGGDWRALICAFGWVFFGMDLGAFFPLYGSVCDPAVGVNDDQSDLFWLSQILPKLRSLGFLPNEATVERRE